MARHFFADENICVSTDGIAIKEVTEKAGLNVPFLRPANLATDTAGTYEVLLHALKFYEKNGRSYSKLLLLQPTSPFRSKLHFYDMFKKFDESADMIVSVGLSHHNPYFSLFEENENGYLVKSKNGNSIRRQDCPPAYYYNGSMYLINVQSLKQHSLHQFTKIEKYIMEEKYCLDIDTPVDWIIGEALLNKKVFDDFC